ncbi:MAG: PEP/pyruvate-binding domain-containing protein, partial [Muribaculaceae bacterium]|nr:PEP/pyruvate-binding domain-containing protein [Muribaculaceae bacterium]
MGGKARGLAFVDSIIKRHPECDDFDGVTISIPRTIVICTDIFDEFMSMNNLYPIALSTASDEEILEAFVNARLPEIVRGDILALRNAVDGPIAVRSSSLLEDSHYQPFAGIYSTYMVPKADNPEEMLHLVTTAIKSVYASVFFEASKTYMAATSNVIDQEKMAVILQEVVGEYHGDYFFPSFSGVGRSLNYYPINDEKAEEGVAQVAVGLGKYIVDGGRSLRFSPSHPANVLQTSTLDLALKDTQTRLYAIDKNAGSKTFSVDDGFNIASKRVQDFADTGVLRQMVSTYDPANDMLFDYETGKGRRVVTFNNILRDNSFPLAQTVDYMLKLGQKEMCRPVEIEFAGTINQRPGEGEMKGNIYWLQIRPIIDKKDMVDDDIIDIPDSEALLKSYTALGHGNIDNIDTIVYVRPEAFNSMNNVRVAEEIEKINKDFLATGTNYILIGPGRWGSSDSALGIPVKWPAISAARLIVEASLSNYRIEPSQGTHFFQNLTSFGVGYFTINPTISDGVYNIDYLNSMPAVYESERVRIVKFPKPLNIAINGKKGIGVVAEAKDATGENDKTTEN